MTTERRQPSRMSTLELRLYIAALLAVVYAISWRAIGGQASATAPAVETAPPIDEPQPRFVWIDQLPPSKQPAIALPPGWQRASETPRGVTASPQPSRVLRVANQRVRRVRTRSS